MENSKKDYQRFDEPPFRLIRVVCGIDALIEVLKLPIEKLPKNDIRMSEVGLKLYELSVENRRRVMNLGGQSLQLQEIIESRCTEVSTIEEVLKLSEQKYQHLLNTNSLI
jgi:hypothetical protein